MYRLAVCEDETENREALRALCGEILDELKVLLSDPDVDLSTVAEVDGVHVTLEELKLVLEIEQYLAYIQVAYFTRQDLTGEQITSFYDLADAWASGAVTFSSGSRSGVNVLTNDADGVGPSGVGHGVRVSVSSLGGSTLDNINRTGTFYATISTSDTLAEPVTMASARCPAY